VILVLSLVVVACSSGEKADNGYVMASSENSSVYFNVRLFRADGKPLARWDGMRSVRIVEGAVVFTDEYGQRVVVTGIVIVEEAIK